MPLIPLPGVLAASILRLSNIDPGLVAIAIVPAEPESEPLIKRFLICTPSVKLVAVSLSFVVLEIIKSGFSMLLQANIGKKNFKNMKKSLTNIKD